tara:strand:+ start:122 stop:442 length:321 start_codon:yes stop_codon:yes gene_type:complete
MANKWQIAGFLFSTASVVLLISLMMNIHTYYIKEMESGTETLSEVCDEIWDDETFSVLQCHPIKQEKYNLFAGTLLCAGFAFLCFAKYGETKIEDKTTISTNQSQQ